jgi:hypothetical protein
MTQLALALCLAIAAVGAVGVASPPRLLEWVRRFQSQRGVLIMGVVRVLLGVALFLAAPESRAPGVLRPLGLLVVLIGFVTPVFGPERFRRLLDAWAQLGPTPLRLWSGVACLFGLALAWAVWPAAA